MAESYRALPLHAENGGYTVIPPQSSSVPSSAPSGPLPAGSAQGRVAAATQADVNQDGELTPEEVDHLKTAAVNGDQEAMGLLKALGIGLGAAALGGGAIVGGLALRKALQRAQTNYPGYGDVDINGNPKFVDAANLPSEPGVYYPGENQPANYNVPATLPPQPSSRRSTGASSTPEVITPEPPPQRLLPAPNRQIAGPPPNRITDKSIPPGSAIPMGVDTKTAQVEAAYAQRAAQQAAEQQAAALQSAAAQAKSMRLGRAFRSASGALRRGL